MSNRDNSFEDYIKNYNPDEDVDETFRDGSICIDKKTGEVIGDFYKNNKNDKIWWIDNTEQLVMLFTFDKKKIFSLWGDYPYNLTKEQKELFDKENPYWRDFFKNRKNK